MKSKKVSPKKDSTLLYSVNLETLAIEVCDNTQISHGYDCVTTTYENFVVDDDVDQAYYNDDSNHILYFKTRDEAFDFVKSQLGM